MIGSSATSAQEVKCYVLPQDGTLLARGATRAYAVLVARLIRHDTS